MIDFTQRLKRKERNTVINPLEIYESLDRRSVAGPLRPSQLEILNKWWGMYKDKKDNIIKLHTGEGKTLIGLLLLQSKLNEYNQPCVYVCPNIYLADQVMDDARKFGIPYCSIDETRALPDDFLSGRKILITYVQKLFNGRTVFGLGAKSVDVGSIILDDSQACIDSIKSSMMIKVRKDHSLFKKILGLFSDELRDQGEGSFLEIENGVSQSTILAVPYWTWIEKKDAVAKILLDYVDDKKVKYAWPLIKDSLQCCQAFFSGEYLEISPFTSVIEKFGSFSNAKFRFLMSATTQDDSFFIKGLGFDIDAVKNPMKSDTLLWSGEKMILIPSLINDDFTRDRILNWLLQPYDKRIFGTVCLTPSFKNKEQFENIGAVVSTTDTMFSNVEKLKNGVYSEAIVFANRYDGIDLPDDSCRILIIDSKPFSETLTERYEEEVRPSSDIINIKIAQKVEQGLGRSVRGQKDYSVIVLVGGDLVQFIKSPLTKKYFSEQTKQQIEIGNEIVSFAKEELAGQNLSSSQILVDILNKCTTRDDGWKQFYVERMGEIKKSVDNKGLYDLILLENKAEKLFVKGDVDRACKTIQDICDHHVQDPREKGWYLQLLARYMYSLSKAESNKYQKSAFQNNNSLLKPRDGIEYKKIGKINTSRTQRIKEWMASYDDYQSLMIDIDGVLENLSYGVHSEKFEKALDNLGGMIGFVCQRPDKEIRKGPDNLWADVDNQYIMFECKNEVDEDRKEINKDEAGQMNNHCGWFDDFYPGEKCLKFMIINTRHLSYHADFTHEVRIIKKNSLRTLKNNVRSFFKEFRGFDIHQLSDEKIHELIIPHKLSVHDFYNEYSESVIKTTR
ncbi:TPA: DEAD/DEAH box helicase family protein [Klebsiella pneumoniae]|uniref:DEAD/DEAH box helicase n=3 Tax=Klebsiella pneumoniae TaxID=573 RepID=UPI0010342DC7|nr:DEAD/DEAH box helicase family protein [Klebsiella pneumoniae]HBV6183115.1 DEAD/DEAH box helicase family protein [Klebsiella pneumoniae]HCB9372573.1 DEAD/DEAH box helicase family protein [Klebsiella pneumoniae]HDK6455961.1 DEAD/DEAH box helicase family protein [Klebsiella pneumoniae]